MQTSLTIEPHLPKEELFGSLSSQVTALDFKIREVDSQRPWGGFIKISEDQAQRFIAIYFPGVLPPEQAANLSISPKFLIVERGKRLSWQTHERRSEYWHVLDCPVGVKLSESDSEPNDIRTLQKGEVIYIPTGVRHRLIGLDHMGIVAEMWIHTDSANPSNEGDIRRIQDDYAGMKGR